MFASLEQMSATTFCSICQNLMFVRMGEQPGSLVASCNYCLSKRDITSELSGGAVVISDTAYKSDAAKYSHFMTPLLHDDPTLPRVRDVRCPNPACTKDPGEADLALFVKYDADNLKFLYSCTFCKHFWVPGAALSDKRGVAGRREAEGRREAAAS